MIAFACPRCGMKLKVKDEFAGRSSRCPTCKQAFVVPLPDKTEVPIGEVEGMDSSLVRAGVDGGVTLEQAGWSGKKPVRPFPSGQSKKGQRYIIEGEIARGGMGAVLRAMDCDIRREVAVKYLLDQANSGKKARFIEEAQITGQLEHPNIPPIHELGVDAQKRLFFSMKMVKGRSLDQVLNELRQNPKSAPKEWSLPRLLTIFVSVCNALAYAHARGVVHRDLKPANIMVGDFGEVYVMDWGLAKVQRAGPSTGADAQMATLVATAPIPAPRAIPAEPSIKGSRKVETSREIDADLTQEGAVIGTPVYMAPEQAAGQVEAIGPRSDIYSLGAILYEMLTLQPPVDKTAGYLGILMQVAQGEIMPPEQRSRTRRIPKELSAIAMKALAKNPQDRYPTVEALRKDIERFQEGRSVSAKDDTKWEALLKFAKRNKGFSAGAVLSLTVLLGSFGFLAKAYAELKSERQARRDQGRVSVPSFVRAGQMLLNEGRFSDALAQTDVALDFDAKAAEAKLLRGHALVGLLRFREAHEELQGYVKLRPNDSGAKLLAERCRQINQGNTTELAALANELNRQKNFVVADAVTSQAKKVAKSRNEMLSIYRKRIEAAWPGSGGKLGAGDDGFHLDLGVSRDKVTDLSPLKGIPLVRLELLQCDRVRDLSPLKGMPLIWLNLGNCKQVRDLTPLQGMPITWLNLDTCEQVRDLTPLKGMPLKTLDLSHCGQVGDLAPLHGMKLTRLSLTTTAVTDLAPLKGMPLTTLSLHGCRQVRDLSPLKGMGLTSLDCSWCPVADLTPLKDMPLKSLGLFQCSKVRDLTPLKGMPLKSLDVAGCAAQDLSPLQGMSLTEVGIDLKTITQGMTVLRSMATLKSINVGAERREKLIPEQFWKRYDAGEFRK